MPEPIIIQGGMGAGVSHWKLARAVSRAGQLGVVSGTALDGILARRLQTGDPDGDLRRAFDTFPIPAMAKRVWDRYFIPGGKSASQSFRPVPMYSLDPPVALIELAVVSNYLEVILAREGHDGLVGINYLEKIQMPTLPALYGAMLGGVDYVLMGAGIPMAIPGAMDRFAAGQPASIPIDVAGLQAGESYTSTFDPATLFGGPAPAIKRGKFLAIISSNALALAMARRASGRVDGFIVEGSTAGGHNAPPRGPLTLSARGEPVYGPRDLPDLEKIRALGLPFWLAGSYAEPARVAEAMRIGAAGVQVGTAFAFTEEAGVEPELRRQILEAGRAGTLDVFTDPRASPTGFPLKVLRVPGTVSQDDVFNARERRCDLGYLRHVYRKADGSVGYRCPAEPADQYLKKGGAPEDLVGRKCVCNGLVGTIGLKQIRSDGYLEPALVTAGDDVTQIARFLPPEGTSYSAASVITYLLSGVDSQ